MFFILIIWCLVGFADVTVSRRDVLRIQNMLVTINMYSLNAFIVVIEYKCANMQMIKTSTVGFFVWSNMLYVIHRLLMINLHGR